MSLFARLLAQTSQLHAFSVDVTLAANRLIQQVVNMMDKIKYYWVKTIRTITSRKTVLALLQINVSFFFDSEEIYT